MDSEAGPSRRRRIEDEFSQELLNDQVAGPSRFYDDEDDAEPSQELFPGQIYLRNNIPPESARDRKRRLDRERRQSQTETQREQERERGRIRISQHRERRRNQRGLLSPANNFDLDESREENEAALLQQQQQMEREREQEQEQEQRRIRDRQYRERRRNQRPANFRAAVYGTEFSRDPIPDNFGEMDELCKFDCGAKHFREEPLRLKHNCCHKGKYLAPPISDYPQSLRNLLTGDGEQSRNFRDYIRQYNSAHAFASFGAKIEDMPPGRGPYCFKIIGEVYHLATSTLVHNLPNGDDAAPRYGQIYVYDSDAAVRFRMEVRQNVLCHAAIMHQIDEELRRVNPYVQEYRRLHEAVQNEEVLAQQHGRQPVQYELRLIRNPRDDPRRYNAPVNNRECMYLIQSVDGEVADLDLAVHPRGERGCQRINGLSRHVDPMVFPLFFPCGDAGWCINPPNAFQAARNMSPLQFYSSRIAVRGHFNPLFSGGKLFQQFLVHVYCRVEANNLSFLRRNQKQLRVECYQGLIDYLANQANERHLRAGNMVILPTSFVGGPRYMRDKYLDAMTIVRRFGKPVYFITFTCNPQWIEITSILEEYQQPCDRPDMAAKVFMLKVERFIQLMTKQHILGKVIAYVFVIEFQKRGLPHVHSLFWLDPEDQLLSGEDVDQVICAEIPNEVEDPDLYRIITRNNIHGPCGMHTVNCAPNCHDHNPACPCMYNDVCKKSFPKPFQENTDITGAGYPKYRRRDNRREIHIVRQGRVHNGLVVPYNAYISKTFDAHINVEMCHTIQAIKYFMKGHDRARAGFIEGADGALSLDEIKQFVDTRCITPPEATWRLLENPLHEQSHTIVSLAVHEENGQQIFFEEGDEEEAAQRAAAKNSTLTAWFELNRDDLDARRHLYHDIPTMYVWTPQNTWRKRKIGLDKDTGRNDMVLARIASVSPRQVELFHLRLLLIKVKGATSFQDLRTVNDVVYDTFRESALARGLIIDDQEWFRCMEESAAFMMPFQLRSLFAMLLIHCTVIDPLDLWTTFRPQLIEDFVRRGIDEEASTTLALLELQAELETAGFSLDDKGNHRTMNCYSYSTSYLDKIMDGPFSSENQSWQENAVRRTASEPNINEVLRRGAPEPGDLWVAHFGEPDGPHPGENGWYFGSEGYTPSSQDFEAYLKEREEETPPPKVDSLQDICRSFVFNRIGTVNPGTFGEPNVTLLQEVTNMVRLINKLKVPEGMKRFIYEGSEGRGETYSYDNVMMQDREDKID